MHVTFEIWAHFYQDCNHVDARQQCVRVAIFPEPFQQNLLSNFSFLSPSDK